MGGTSKRARALSIFGLGTLLHACGAAGGSGSTVENAESEHTSADPAPSDEPERTPSTVTELAEHPGMTWGDGAPERDGAPMHSDLAPDDLLWIRNVVAGTSSGPLVDEEAREQIMRGADVSGVAEGPDTDPLRLGLPPGCEPAFRTSPGYTTIAIPPAMNDDTEEEAALVDTAVRLLSEGLEIAAWCNRQEDVEVEVEDPDAEEDTYTTETQLRAFPVWVINVVRGPDGVRIRAWSTSMR